MKPSPQRATLERQGKRKAEADGKRNKTSEPTWHGENQHQPQHATGQTYLDKGERKNTWKRDPWGTSWWHDASTTRARFVIRLKGPRHSFHNLLDSLRVQPLNYVHNWTSPTTKRKETTPKVVNLPGHSNMMHWSCVSVKLSSSSEKEGLLSQLPAMQKATGGRKMTRPDTAAHCSTHRHRQVKPGKRPAVSLYLDFRWITNSKV